MQKIICFFLFTIQTHMPQIYKFLYQLLGIHKTNEIRNDINAKKDTSSL